MSIRALYAPWPEGARRTWGWGALGLIVFSYGLSSAPVMVGTILFVALDMAGANGDALGAQQALSENTLTVLLPLLLAQFVLWGVLALVWAKLFERRDLASMGMAPVGALRRYLVGLPLGVGLVLLIGLAALALSGLLGEAGAVPETPAGYDMSRAVTTAALGGYALLIGVFLVQGGVEEVVFRGWLMSTLVARWGHGPGVVAASFAFAALHAHVFVSGLVYGAVALTGIGLTGLVFALMAVWRRHIAEAAAAHGAFNATAVIAPTMMLLATDPDHDIHSAVAQVFTGATGMAGADAVSVGPQTLAQLLAMGGVSLILLAVIAMRRRRGERRRR